MREELFFEVGLLFLLGAKVGGGDEEDVDEVEGDEGEGDDGEEGSESEEEEAGVADEA